MKIRFYILTCLLFGGLVSCNDWLDVKPETEMTLEEMYADQQGFQDALTGAYLELKNSSAYGTELMYGTIEYLAQHWDYTAESIQEKISQFNYIDDNVQNRFTLIYTQLYKIILSVNAILEQIDAKQDVFEPGMYEIIKGECLAMRAYCHFDLLRLFGPMPTRTTASKILPYVTKVGIEYNTHHSYQEFTELLENDLTDAGKLLYPFDPVIPAGEDREELNLSLSAENFLTARQIRFNYYAVKAMEARFYLWLGGDDNKAKAYDCATEVIEHRTVREKQFSLWARRTISPKRTTPFLPNTSWPFTTITSRIMPTIPLRPKLPTRKPETFFRRIYFRRERPISDSYHCGKNTLQVMGALPIPP